MCLALPYKPMTLAWSSEVGIDYLNECPHVIATPMIIVVELKRQIRNRIRLPRPFYLNLLTYMFCFFIYMITFLIYACIPLVLLWCWATFRLFRTIFLSRCMMCILSWFLSSENSILSSICSSSSYSLALLFLNCSLDTLKIFIILFWQKMAWNIKMSPMLVIGHGWHATARTKQINHIITAGHKLWIHM
jgi:hypothetical protein